MLGNAIYRPADPIKEVELASADDLSIRVSWKRSLWRSCTPSATRSPYVP